MVNEYFTDSGGPLVDLRTKKLIGIVSFGLESGRCAIDGVPGEFFHFYILKLWICNTCSIFQGVYTRVASIRPWIRQIIRF